MKRKDLIKEAIWAACVCLTTVFILIIIFHLWSRSLAIPFEYTGDSISSFMEIKNMILGNDIYNHTNIAAPFGDLQYAGIKGYILHIFLMKGISLFTNDVFIVANIYYLLSFVLISLTCYYVLIKLNVNRVPSMMLGVIYSMLPYHIIRSESHIYLSSYFLIPLMTLVVIYLLNGEIGAVDSKEQMSFSELIYSCKNRKMFFAIVICMLIGFSDVYYSVFACIILCFAGVYSFIEKKQKRQLFYTFFIITFIGVSLFVTFLPQLWYIVSTKSKSVFFDTRSLQDIEVYGLKWIQLILPIQFHRVEFLANFRKLYDGSFPMNNENGVSSLGGILSIGFLISIFGIFFNKITDKYNNLIAKLGKVNLFCILVSGVGGLASIIGILVTKEIRSYNRMSIFIAMFSVISTGIIVTELYNRIKRPSVKKCACVLIAIILVLGVFDCTSDEEAYSSNFDPFTAQFLNTYENIKIKFYSDKEFVNRIEASVDKGAMIFEMPIIAGTIYNYYPNGVIGGKDMAIPFLHATTTKWSAGAIVRTKGDLWLQGLRTLPIEKLMKIIVLTGFEGIYIDSKGYSQKDFTLLISELNEIFGIQPMISVNRQLYFYNIIKYAAKVRSAYSDEERNSMNAICLGIQNNIQYHSFTDSNIYYRGATTANDNSMILHSDTFQYGPYISLGKGTYQIVVDGENFDNVNYGVSYNNGEQNVETELIQRTNNELIYRFTLNEDAANVEIKLYNNTNMDIGFRGILVECISDSTSTDTLGEMWNRLDAVTSIQ